MRNYRGFIDMVVDGSTAPITFAAQIIGNKATDAYPVIDRRGRGTNGPKIRLGDFSGSGSGTGKVQWAAFPYPPLPKYATGTITRVLKENVDGTVTHSVAIPVRITNITWEYVEKNNTGWEITFSWVADGNPTIVWNGAQVTINAPSANDVETYNGLSKSYDPSGLATGAQQRIECEGISDSDSAEVTKLVALVAAAVAPMNYLKVLSAQWSRSDTYGGAVILTWALQDTKDQQETPRNTLTIDPNDIKSARGFATVYASGGDAPSWPAAPTGMKQVNYQDLKLNDQYQIRIWQWGKVDSKDEQELPRTNQSDDATSINSEGSIAQLDGTPSVPSGYVLVSTETEHVTTDHSITTLKYALRTTAGGIEMDESPSDTDPSDLETIILDTHVYDQDGTAPAASPPSGLQLSDTKDIQLNNVKRKVTYRYEKNTSADRATLPRTWLETDLDGVTNNGSVAVLDGTPSVPSGYVLVKSRADYLTPDHTRTTYEYGLATPKQAMEYAASETTTDPQSLHTFVDDAHVYTTTSGPPASVAPSGLKLTMTTTKVLNNIKSRVVYRYGLLDSADEVLLPRSGTMQDPKNLQDMVRIAQIWMLGSEPSDPDAPTASDGSTLKLISRRDENLTAADTSAKRVRVWVYGRNTSADDIERSIRHGSFSSYDPNTLDGSARVTKVALTSTPPATPSAPIAGVTFARLVTRPTTDDYTIYMWEYEPLDSKGRMELTETATDGASIDLTTIKRIPLVDGTPSAPSGLKLIQTNTRDLANGHVLTEGIFGKRNSNDKITYDGSEVSIGIYQVDNTEQKVEIESCLAADKLEDLIQAKYLLVKDTTSPTQGAPFRRIKARRYHDMAVIYTTIWSLPTGWIKLPPGDKIRIKGNYGPIKAKSWVGFNSSNIPSLSVLSCLTRGSGKYLVQLGQFETLGVGGPLTIYKTYTGSTPPLGTSSILKTNSSTFLGFPVGSVMYLGASYDITVESGGSTTYDMSYNFTLSITANWVGFPTLTGIPPGGLIHTTSSVSAGALLPGSGGPPTYTWSALPGVSCTLPGTDSFSFQTWTQ